MSEQETPTVEEDSLAAEIAKKRKQYFQNQLLKIKIKTLAAEAEIIRKQERKWLGDNRAVLHHHRTVDVRKACRRTQLAYAFLRGRDYAKTETLKVSDVPDWDEVYKMVKRYSAETDSRVLKQLWAAWEPATPLNQPKPVKVHIPGQRRPAS